MANAIDISNSPCVSVSKADLARALSKVKGAVAKSLAMPLLECVKLESDGSSLTVTCTDLYTHVSAKVPADGAPFVACVPFKALAERIKALPKGSITLAPAPFFGPDASKDSSLTVGPYTVRGIDADEFPAIASVDKGANSIAADVLRGMFDRTFASISKDETRVHLNALLLEWTDNEVHMVATDGHRLAFERAHVATRQLEPVSFLLSRSAVVAVRSAIKGTDGLVSLAFGTNGSHAQCVTFRANGVTVTSRGVDAEFPPYAQVIPANHPTSVRLSRVAFIDAVRTVAVAASDRTGGIKLSVGRFGFFLSAESPDSGNAHASLPTIGDPPVNEFRAGVNSVYLLDALTSLECDEFIFSCNGPLDPMTIHPYNVDTLAPADSLAVVMPMRI